MAAAIVPTTQKHVNQPLVWQEYFAPSKNQATPVITASLTDTKAHLMMFLYRKIHQGNWEN